MNTEFQPTDKLKQETDISMNTAVILIMPKGMIM
jgi:hypothetical protein